MKHTVVVLMGLFACGSPAQPEAAPEAPAAEEAAPAATEAEAVPSKAALAHFCTSMATMNPAEFADVEPAKLQEAIALRMAKSAEGANIADWGTFEAWNAALTAETRQAAFEALIVEHGLETECAGLRGPADADADAGDAEAGDAEAGDAEPADAEPADAEPADAEAGDAEGGDAEPAAAEPADAEPSDAEPAEAAH